MKLDDVIQWTIIGAKGMVASLVSGAVIGAVAVILLSNWPGIMTGFILLGTLPLWGWFVNRFWHWK
jgi:hypothetical protein